MSLECTTEDCANHTSTFLCSQCVADLQAWLDKVPGLIEALDVTVAKLDNVRSAGGGGGGSKPGSAAPLNLDALQLQENLRSVVGSAKDYAQDERAAGIAWMVQDWATKAELLVSGPEAEVINQAQLQARIQEAYGEPLPPREAIDYLRTKAKLTVKMYDFKNWVKLGHLQYVLDHVRTDDKARRIYYPGDIFRVAQKMRDKRIKV
jgi:hypothetical protein